MRESEGRVGWRSCADSNFTSWSRSRPKAVMVTAAMIAIQAAKKIEPALKRKVSAVMSPLLAALSLRAKILNF
jgi:hypothetical protein